MTAPDAPLPAPTQQDRDEAYQAVLGMLNGTSSSVAEAIATARREGFRAGIESAAKVADDEAVKCGQRDGNEWDVARCTALIIARDARALSPDAADHAADHGDGR